MTAFEEWCDECGRPLGAYFFARPTGTEYNGLPVVEMVCEKCRMKGNGIREHR